MRVIKPDFYESEAVGALSMWARQLLLAVWSYVDDNGVQKDLPVGIASECFRYDLAHDAAETLKRIEEGMTELVENGWLIRYQVNGVRLIEATGWEFWQKPKNPSKPRFPTSQDPHAILDQPLPTSSVDPTETLRRTYGGSTRFGVAETETEPDTESEPETEKQESYLGKRVLGENPYKSAYNCVQEPDDVADDPWADSDEPSSRAAGANPRALGTNPRALGKNPRALGTNPRALGTNPKAQQHADSPDPSRSPSEPPSAGLDEKDELDSDPTPCDSCSATALPGKTVCQGCLADQAAQVAASRSGRRR